MSVSSMNSSVVTCSNCATTKHGVSQDDQIKGIERVNKSVGWEGYNVTITPAIGQKQLLLAVQEGQISGYALCYGMRERESYIAYIAVDASQHRAKIGSKLMERIFHKTVKHGAVTLSVDFRGRLHDSPVGQENTRLVNFYSGFPYPNRIQKTDCGYYPNGDTRYSITYNLPQPAPLSDRPLSSDVPEEKPL